jgi:hypothetical protein
MRRFRQPDPDVAEVVSVHCYGCGRKIGVGHEDKGNLHCSELCWNMEQLISLENAARDRFVVAMAEYGVTQIAIARIFGLSRAWVYQVLLAAGNNQDYLLEGRQK